MPIPGIIASQITGHLNNNAYESIATATPEGTNSFSFTSIPQTYKHLQIRASWDTQYGNGNITYTLNGTAGTKSHYSYGYGSSYGSGSLNGAYMSLESGAGKPYAMIFDLLDYTNTNKLKTGRSFIGVDFNGSGIVELVSSYVPVTAAVTSIVGTLSANQFAPNAKIALYGIKG